MEASPRSVAFRDVLDDPSNFLQWAKETGLEQIPLLGTMMAGGAAGFAVGGPIGMALGWFAPLVFGVGEAQMAIKERDPSVEAPVSALAAGTFIAMLDRVVPGWRHRSSQGL